MMLYIIMHKVFGLLRKQKLKMRIAIDVGSHTIKALVFQGNEHNPNPAVIKKSIIHLPQAQPDTTLTLGALRSEIEEQMLHKATKTAAKLRELIFSLIREIEQVPEKITIGLGPHLAAYTLETWEIGRTRREKKISHAELVTYFTNLFDSHRDPHYSMIAYPLEFLANGYRVDTRDLTVSGVHELTFKTLLLKFSHDVGIILTESKQTLGGMPIEFVPLIVAHKEAFVNVLNVKDAFLIDVGGDYTELVLLKDGFIAQFSSFPVGAQHFLTGIARMASVPIKEADDLKRQYVQGLMNEQKSKKIHDFLVQESEIWKTRFSGSLDSFYHAGPIPKQVFLFGGGAYLNEIGSILRAPDWFKNFSYTQSPLIRILDASAFFEGSTKAGFLQGPEDVGLASLAIYSLLHEPLF